MGLFAFNRARRMRAAEAPPEPPAEVVEKAPAEAPPEPPAEPKKKEGK